MSRSITYEAVLFDVGQTLIQVYPSVGEIYADVAARHGVEASAAELESAFRRLWTELRGNFIDDRGCRMSEEDERAWWRSLVEGVFERAGKRDDFQSFDDFFRDVFELFAHPEVWKVFDDVRPTIEELERCGLRMGVISNWDRRLHVLLERLELRPHFEFVVASADVGHRKPHPRIFEEALKRLGLPAEKVVYVGDSYEDDVVGAQAMGMRPLRIDRRQPHFTDDCLASLSDLLLLL